MYSYVYMYIVQASHKTLSCLVDFQNGWLFLQNDVNLDDPLSIIKSIVDEYDKKTDGEVCPVDSAVYSSFS